MGWIQAVMMQMRAGVSDFVHDEEGDTNFISIIVILGIVLVVAAAFIAFGNNIIEWVNTNLLGSTSVGKQSQVDKIATL